MAHITLTPSQIPEGSYAVAECERCQGHRYVTRALMTEKAGDIPLWQIEPRLRCVERRGDKRGPACGGRMNLGLSGPPRENLPADVQAERSR